MKANEDQKESVDAEAPSKGMWMDFTVNGTVNDDKLTMKTEEHAISDGLNPMEYFASSIQSCLQVMFVIVATEKEIKLGEVTWTTTISVDPKGSAGTPMTITLFADIQVDKEDASKINEVVQVAESRCPLMALCKKVGLKPTLNYTVNGNEGILCSL